MANRITPNPNRANSIRAIINPIFLTFFLRNLNIIFCVIDILLARRASKIVRNTRKLRKNAATIINMTIWTFSSIFRGIGFAIPCTMLEDGVISHQPMPVTPYHFLIQYYDHGTSLILYCVRISHIISLLLHPPLTLPSGPSDTWYVYQGTKKAININRSINTDALHANTLTILTASHFDIATGVGDQLNSKEMPNVKFHSFPKCLANPGSGYTEFIQ